ncbi:MAG: radical SAM protein [Magnetococcales bacterium]|nr:radical SAM protein [Magnetococcales bacterium]
MSRDPASPAEDDATPHGHVVEDKIPDDAPLAARPGHKLRSGGHIVERGKLGSIPVVAAGESPTLSKQRLEIIAFEQEQGFIRQESDAKDEEGIPNRFTGPTYRTQRERFRFDGHKMNYHLDRVMAWQRGERIAPVHIDMGLTKFCNTACIYCYAVMQNMTRGKMIEREALLRFIEDCGRLEVRSIGFIGDGEPTLNPAVYDAAVLARKVGVDTSMATNGLLLEMDRAHDILRDMVWIRFNLSAATPEAFQRVHQSKGSNFPLLMEKIRELVRIRRENGYPCTLGLQMVLIPENFDQALPLARLGAELGVDYLVIKHCSDSEYKELGIDYSEYARATEDLKAAEKLSTKEYVVQVKWNKIGAAGETYLYKDGYRKYDVCYGTPFLSQISGNGEVYPCGPFYGKKRFLMGDLHQESYYDIVKGDRYWAVHEDIRKSVDVHKDCAIGCRQDYINKFLWDMMNPPEHVNFI